MSAEMSMKTVRDRRMVIPRPIYIETGKERERKWRKISLEERVCKRCVVLSLRVRVSFDFAQENQTTHTVLGGNLPQHDVNVSVLCLASPKISENED